MSRKRAKDSQGFGADHCAGWRETWRRWAKRIGRRIPLFPGARPSGRLLSSRGAIAVVDLAADRLIDDKMLTFRGDPNEAWLRAEEFLVEEMRALEIAK